jgi:hypothetical protein
LQLFWCGRQSRQLLSYGSPFPFPRLNKQETVEWQTKCRNKNTFGIVSDAASDKSGRNSKQQTVTNSTQCRLDLWRDYVYTFTKMDEMECSYLIQVLVTLELITVSDQWKVKSYFDSLLIKEPTICGIGVSFWSALRDFIFLKNLEM